MISLEDTRQKLFDLLVAKSFEITTRDAKGKKTQDPTQADLFSFGYKVGEANYGTVVVTINPKGELEVYYGDVLGKGMDSEDKKDWYDFLYQLRHFAKRNMLEFSLKHMNKLKYAMQTMAQVTESKYYGFKKTSYTKPTQEAKLKIVHTKPIDEEQGDQRYRNISALFVETANGERFKLPFTKLYGGRAMARHVSEGGNPYDSFGQYICELVSDIETLGAFTRYARGKDWQDAESTELAERGLRHFGDIKRKVKSMIGKRGYHKAFEEHNSSEQPQQEVVERVRELFTERLLDQRVESAIPVLAKLELEGKSMKEIKEFESWAEDMSYDVNEGFDPDSWEGEMEWEFAGDDGEPGYGGVRYTVVVDKEQNKAFVDPKSLNAWCNGDGNNKLTDEWCTSMVQPGGELHDEALLAAQEDVDAEWDARDADVPMEDKEYECPTCRGAGDWRDEEHKKHDCPDCDGEGKYVDVDDLEEDKPFSYGPVTLKAPFDPELHKLIQDYKGSIKVLSWTSYQDGNDAILLRKGNELVFASEYGALDPKSLYKKGESAFENLWATWTDGAKRKVNGVIHWKKAEDFQDWYSNSTDPLRKLIKFGNNLYEELEEGKMKDLALDLEELSDQEFEEKYQSKKSDWDEVKTPGLRQDPSKPAYVKKDQKPKDWAQAMMADDVEVTEEYAPSVGDQIVTGKGTKGTVESVTDESVEFRTETGKLLRTKISNVQPDAVNEDDFEEGNEFTMALANAKRDGKKEFEVDGKVYKVEENYAERLRTLINW